MERFWVGASDLGERGNFLWYNADRHVSDANWSEEGRPEEEVSQFREGDVPILAKLEPPCIKVKRKYFSPKKRHEYEYR